jgi:hypothetical protein
MEDAGSLSTLATADSAPADLIYSSAIKMARH